MTDCWSVRGGYEFNFKTFVLTSIIYCGGRQNDQKSTLERLGISWRLKLYQGIILATFSPQSSFFFTSKQRTMDPAFLCKVFFGLGTAVDIGGTAFPSFRKNIMNYGSRGTNSSPEPPQDQQPISENTLRVLFDYVASFKVPHTWFTHYYVLSVASSIFWAAQIMSHGNLIQFLAYYSWDRDTSMTVNQVVLAWTLMTVHGLRRLYESLTFTKPSQSTMWIGLWLLGMAYYVFMGISVWVEGICK